MSSFWNMPPVNAFSTALTTSRGKTLKVQWPPGSLPESLYYISLYFQDSRTKSPYSWRVFDVSVNGNKFYSNLNVTADGVAVFAAQWPLSGQTQIEMTPGDGIPVGPLINAGEVFQLLPLGGRTLTRDGNLSAISILSQLSLYSSTSFRFQVFSRCRSLGSIQGPRVHLFSSWTASYVSRLESYLCVLCSDGNGRSGTNLGQPSFRLERRSLST